MCCTVIIGMLYFDKVGVYFCIGVLFFYENELYFCSGDECIRHLQLQLSYVYNQILSVLTLASLNKIYKDRVNFDLRRMLVGTEKFIDNILKVMDTDTSYVLGSVQCLPLNSTVRDTITQTILQSCNKVKVSESYVLTYCVIFSCVGGGGFGMAIVWYTEVLKWVRTFFFSELLGRRFQSRIILHCKRHESFWINI